MNTAASALVKIVSEIRDLQAEIAEISSAIRKHSSTEESVRCFILRLLLNRDVSTCPEIDILSSPICMVQLGILRRAATQRDQLENKLAFLRNSLVEKFREHDYYQEEALFTDLRNILILK
jgi:hypothetical protein